MNQFKNGISIASNTTSTALSSNASWTGQGFDVSQFSSVVLACKTDATGTAYIDFSPDNSNWDSSLSFAVEANVNEVHRLSVTRQFFRVRYSNGASSQSFFRLQSIAGNQNLLTSTLSSSIQPDGDAIISRSVLMGKTDGNNYINVPVTPEGHLEVALHSPRNPFGSIHTENLLPIFQADAVYGINSQLIKTFTGLGGYITESDSQWILSTNTNVGGNATIQSRKRLRYRPGQGCVTRFTAVFTTGVPLSVQVAGVGHPEDGLYFGYSGSSFGVLHSYGGLRESRLLTITSPGASAGTVSINLNNVIHNPYVTTSTNGTRTAYDISTGIYTGWTAEAIGSGVLFLRNSVGLTNGSYGVTGGATNVIGTFSTIRTGGALTEDWYLQNTWNIDKMDGSGKAGVLLDPTKGNVYQIGYQFLGYGSIVFQIENSPEDNNPDWTSVHSINYPNNNIVPSLRNPSFPFTASAYSLGSTTNLALKSSSFAGFIEGQQIYNGPQFTYNEISASAVTSTAYKALFTIRNKLTFKNKANQGIIVCLEVNAAVKHQNQITTIYLIKNGIFTGTPNFINQSNDSMVAYDNNATSVTFDDNSQLVYSFAISESGQEQYDLKDLGIILQPGESLTVAAKTSSTTAAYVSVSLNTREDQ